VDNLGLVLLLLLESLGQQFLVFRSAVFLDFISKNFLEILEKLVVQLASTIALLARKVLLVDLLAIALETLWRFFIVRDTLLSVNHFVDLLWLQDHAANFFGVTNSIFLTGLGLSAHLGAAHLVFLHSLGLSSTLRCHLVSHDDSIDTSLLGVNVGGIASLALFLGLYNVIISACN